MLYTDLINYLGKTVTNDTDVMEGGRQGERKAPKVKAEGLPNCSHGITQVLLLRTST